LVRFDKNDVGKILVIKTGAIGDVLLSTPVIENLRYNFPDAEINFLTQRYCREVLTGNPYLSRILTFDLGLNDSSYCLLKSINKQKYDLVIDLYSNPRTALITFNSDAKYRVGFPFGLRRFAYNIKVKPRSGEVHNIEFNLDALRALGLEIISTKPCVYLDDIHLKYADEYFSINNLKGDKVIGINSSGSWETKVWPSEYFAELVKRLSGDHKIILFWGYPHEKVEAEKIINQSSGNILILPELNLKYMTGVGIKCDLFISNDTGPAHLIWAAGGRTLTIFGPTKYDLHGHVDERSFIIKNDELNCLGCDLTKISECPNDHRCMRELKVEKVYHEVLRILSSELIPY
jgi:ADP-heptose:LPS heptosyltransferase